MYSKEERVHPLALVIAVLMFSNVGKIVIK